MTAVMKDLGLNYPRVVHYSFVLLQEGKMSTRKGNIVLLEDFMKQSEGKAIDEINKRHGTFDKRHARVIGYGALKYGILRVSPEKSVTFNWEQALSFEGDTAPYIQYAYARIQSILNKNSKSINPKLKLLTKKEEVKLIKHLSNFTNIVEKATKELRPHLIANYVYVLAQLFNEYYHIHPILKAEENVKNARIALIRCVAQVIENGLSLLGIGVLEKM
jgi:arginyl-tRNA synthetase